MADMVQDSHDNNESESWSIEPYEALVFMEQNGAIIPTRIASENSIAGDVNYITQFVKRLLESRRPLLSLEPVKVVHSRRPNTQCMKVANGGKCFLNCLRMDLDRIIDKYPAIGKHNRYFGIFHDAVMREVAFPDGDASLATVARFGWLNSSDINLLPDAALALLVDYSNEAIDRIRSDGNSKAFTNWLTSIERQPKENEETLRLLVEASLSANHHILVLRFDLGYGQFYCDATLSGEMAVSYEDVREHREVLRRFLKRNLKEKLLPSACKGMTFAIKMEYGLDKGYHFHVIVLLNGDVVCRDAGITALICEQWKTSITMGKGGACNCNARIYKRRGIGSIRYGEKGKIDVLMNTVVPYITKPDYYGKMVKPDNHRTFWSSHPPQIEAKPKGRKRKGSGPECKRVR